MTLYRRLSLTSRLLLLVFLAMIPLAALVVALNLERRDSERKAGIGEAGRFAQEMAASMDSFAGEIISFTDAAAIVIAHEPDLTDRALRPYLGTLGTRYPNLRSIFVTDPQGRLLAQSSGDTQTGLDLSSRPYIMALQSGQDPIWSAVQGIETGEVTATFARTIRDSADVVRGFLVVAFYTSNLDDAVAEILEDGDNFVMLDSQGRLVYTASRSEGVLEDLSGTQRVQAALNGEVVTINDEETPFDEGSRYGAIVPVSGMGWAIGYTKSMSALDAQLWAGLLRDLGLLAAVMAVVIVALVLLARQTTRPLRMLAASAAEMAEGAEPSIVVMEGASPDIMQLQRSFANMSEAVRQREELLRQQAERLRSLEQAGASIAAGLDYEQAVQTVTDAGRSLTGAQFAAFFYNQVDESGEQYLLHTLSGLPREAMAHMPMPRNTEIFAPTFNGEGPVRLDDVTQDRRFGKNPPYNGLPQGHPPLRSYMAVPVFSVQGQVLGGLFFGHPEVGVFTAHHEMLASRLATWASIALDNARLYREAQEIQAELRKANVAKDEFLGLVSHELRTPVTTIYGGVRLLASHKAMLDTHQGEELLDTMAEEGARLVRLIEDLLALTRMQLGKTLDLAPADPNDLVRESVTDYVRLRKLRRVNLSLAEGLPPIAVEATYFKQVLTNLLSNADKYSPDSEPIEISTAEDETWVSIVVSDYGPGIDPAEAEKIFESFYRSEKTVDLAAGQGLGLTVCRTLVQAQHGEIWARNREGGGLSVGLRFPAVTTNINRDAEAATGALPS